MTVRRWNAVKNSSKRLTLKLFMTLPRRSGRGRARRVKLRRLTVLDPLKTF